MAEAFNDARLVRIVAVGHEEVEAVELDEVRAGGIRLRATRGALAALVAQAGLGFVTAVDPTAQIAGGVAIGAGTFAARGAIVSVGARSAIT